MDQIQQDATAEPSSPWQVLLPVEILAEVFSYLSAGQLEHVRLTCHRWNQVVCHTPALMRQFVLWFDSGSVLFTDDREEQSKLAANVTGRYNAAHVELGLHGPGVVTPLWAKIGESIENLSLEVGYIDTLIGILRMTPNLKCLTVRRISSDRFDVDVTNGDTRTIDFKLKQLVELNFDGQYVELFCQICPNLQILNVDTCTLEPSGTNIVSLIRATEATLEKLSLNDCNLSQAKYRQICSLDGLHLKELSLINRWQNPWTEPESYMALIRKHPSLEHLKLEPVLEPVLRGGIGIKRFQYDCNPQVWTEIREKLPKLKSLHLKIKDTHSADLPIFLSEMPQLECLGIEISYGSFNRPNFHLSAITNHNLTRLELNSVNLVAEDLAVFFVNSPNIRHLIVTGGITEEIFRSMSGLKRLEHLKGGTCDVLQPDFVLNALKTYTGAIYSTKDLVTVMPNVEQLTSDTQLADDGVLILVQGLKRLKKLTLTNRANITERAFDHLLEHGHALERLRITLNPRDIPTLPEYLARLRQRAIQVWVREDSNAAEDEDFIYSYPGTLDSEDME